MTSLETRATLPARERPRGVTALAYLFALAALLLIIYTAAIAAQATSFTRVSWLVGEGVARMGVIAIGLSAALCGAISFGLFRQNRVAHWAAIAFLAYGLLETVPMLMAALSNFSPLLLAISVPQFLLRTIALWYLFQVGRQQPE
ncbi:MAG TPA: hypothetical protein VF786_03015, partial [Terriglobales bacterium]